MSASRHEHVVHVIMPALRNGDIVICDRFIDSTHVYQGFVGGVSGDVLDGLDKLSCNGLVPDLTLLLDVDSNVGLARTIERGGSESRFEAKGEAFHQKVRQGFLARASKEPNRIVKIDAARPTDDVARDVISAVKPLLAAHGSKMKSVKSIAVSLNEKAFISKRREMGNQTMSNADNESPRNCRPHSGYWSQ